MIIVVPGEPVPKGRPRFGRGHAYTDPKTKAAEERIRALVRQAGIRKPIKNPVGLTIEFWRSSKRRVDIDNLAKLVLDALNGIAWEDDNQIEELWLSKDTATNPHTTIIIRTL